MSEFDALQAAIRRQAAARNADQQECEAFLSALYLALRRASGPGQPLNNISMELVADPFQRLKPPPRGEYYAAWYRLGLCEVLVRVHRSGGAFQGDYSVDGIFHIEDLSPDAVTAFARQLLRDLAETYGGKTMQEGNPALN